MTTSFIKGDRVRWEDIDGKQLEGIVHHSTAYEYGNATLKLDPRYVSVNTIQYGNINVKAERLKKLDD